MPVVSELFELREGDEHDAVVFRQMGFLGAEWNKIKQKPTRWCKSPENKKAQHDCGKSWWCPPYSTHCRVLHRTGSFLTPFYGFVDEIWTIDNTFTLLYSLNDRNINTVTKIQIFCPKKKLVPDTNTNPFATICSKTVLGSYTLTTSNFKILKHQKNKIKQYYMQNSLILIFPHCLYTNTLNEAFLFWQARILYSFRGPCEQKTKNWYAAICL